MMIPQFDAILYSRHMGAFQCIDVIKKNQLFIDLGFGNCNIEKG